MACLPPRPRLRRVRSVYAPFGAAGALFLLMLAPGLACDSKPAGGDADTSTAVRPTPQAFEPAVPLARQHLYPETTDPKAEIAAAIRQAKAEHKRIILDFGGDWCGDCHILDLYLHQQPNGDLLARNYVLVRVFIGHMDHNMDIPSRYQVPVSRGVPALAVLDSSGKLLYAQQHKEFEKDLNPHDVTLFLDKWKA